LHVNNDQPSEFLEVALEAANAAAAISRKYYEGNFTVSTKADLTPVTQADVECEEAIRDIILTRFPEHGFFGEETGTSQADADYLWLVDPIDGTKAFVRRYPFFSTQIALLHAGEIIVGVSSGTMLNELAWAEKGRGAWLNDQPLRVSDIADPDRAAVSTGNLKSLASSDGWANLGAELARADRTRGYGDFYHFAALSIIVREAGGVFTDLNGEEPGLQTRSVMAANAELHGHYLAALRGFVSPSG
jgi:histidinol-phosphatase